MTVHRAGRWGARARRPAAVAGLFALTWLLAAACLTPVLMVLLHRWLNDPQCVALAAVLAFIALISVALPDDHSEDSHYDA